jgi:hypothetical protein
MLALLIAFVLAGCNQRQAPKPAGPEVDVGGRAVSAEGEALTGYGLRFQSDPPDQTKTAMICRVQKDGEFFGRCLPGRYRVTLLLPPKDLEEGKALAAPQYWEVTVPPGGKKSFVLEATKGE